MGAKLFLILFLLFFQIGSIQAQEALPRFDEYRVKSIFTGKPATPIINSRQTNLYRTRLKTAKRFPNFAGHYKINYWGCGSDCALVVITDSKTGKIYFPKQLKAVFIIRAQPENPFVGETPLEFALDSRLLIVTGIKVDSSDLQSEGRFYYEWKDNQLILRKFVSSK